MNTNERKMYDLLLELKEKFNVFSVKAEFEAEGTRTDDLLRLCDIVRRSGLGLTIKIGGCEAIRDLIECKQLGVDRIVAPMIETDYSLKKFIGAINHVYDSNDVNDTSFYMNLETITAYNNIDKISDVIRNSVVNGYVFGRADFCGSLGLGSDDINNNDVLAYAVNVAEKCIKDDLEFVVGGGVSFDSLEFFKTLYPIRLSSFETRKIIFDKDVVNQDMRTGIQLAVNFELAYLENKRDYYQNVASEDLKRIDMLKKRINL
tara:strand:+ start:9523 stop:10305 length:783 start_codon:yes stop_codon:yes gene_type:complete